MFSSACPSALAASRRPRHLCLPAGRAASAIGSKPDHVVSRADCRMRVGDSDGKRRSRHHTERLRADRIPSRDIGTMYGRLQGDSETAPGKPATPCSASPRLRCAGGMRVPLYPLLNGCRCHSYVIVAGEGSKSEKLQGWGIIAVDQVTSDGLAEIIKNHDTIGFLAELRDG